MEELDALEELKEARKNRWGKMIEHLLDTQYALELMG